MTADRPARIERSVLEAGSDVHVDLVVVRGAHDGPTLSILGAIHGDEPEGSLAIDAAIAELDQKHLRGTVRAVAICNVAAAATDSRLSPLDGKNLAREFPGAADGSPTQRLADLLTRCVIEGSDVLVDLHSAGRDYVMPFFAGYEANRPWSAISSRAAMAFGSPLVWEHNSVAPGRSISAASLCAVPSIYVEAMGGDAVTGTTLDALVAGLNRVMSTVGMIDWADAAPPPARVLKGGDGNVDASVSCRAAGMCITRVTPGEPVDACRLIAQIYAEGRPVDEVYAPSAGMVMMLRRKPRVDAGDAIAMLGPLAVAAR